MCDGVVFCIETLSESFVTTEEGNSDIAKVSRFQQIDVRDGLVLSLGENGQNGTLHSAIIVKSRNPEEKNKVKLE